MKKSPKGEVSLSAMQIQATRLNKLEYHRLQRNVDLLRGDLQNHITRIQRQEQGLKLHYRNVVRVIKPNRSYQLWKQAHAHEIAQEEAMGLMNFFSSSFFFYHLFCTFRINKIKTKIQTKKSKTNYFIR